MVVAAPRGSVHTYWQAQGIAELALSHFEDAVQRDDASAERRAFYTLATYYQRTRRIVRSALADKREPLAQAALRNLVVLHRPLMHMHGAASRSVPLAMVLEREDRDEIVRDLVIRALSETPQPMDAARILERVNELDVMGGVSHGTIRRHLKDLEGSGHVARVSEGHKRTGRTYSEVDVDAASLRALVGPDLYVTLAGAGIRGLHDAEARATLLRERFAEVDLCGDTAAALLEAVASLQDARLPAPTGWQHADLLNSPYPRPYQYEAYTVFRASGYQGDLIESPTGSGKTMIGMLCIQDFLRTLRSGQSILVLVPTSNYQQQWIGELCFNRIGLGLPPELVFSGTPGQLERFKRRTGSHPAVILMTYAALAQTGSGVGKGGFDVDSIEVFLQLANIQYVVLDEVHKVVEDMRSVSADVTRQLTEWLRDGSIPRADRLFRHRRGVPTALCRTRHAAGAQHSAGYADRLRLRGAVRRAWSAICKLRARAAHSRLARRVQGDAAGVRRLAGGVAAAGVVRGDSAGGAGSDRSHVVWHVPRASGCGGGDGQTHARVGEGRRDWHRRGADREHRAAGARVVGRGAGAARGARQLAIRRDPLAAGADSGGPGETDLLAVNCRSPSTTRVWNRPAGGPGYHHCGSVSQPQRLVSPRRRRPRRNYQGHHRRRTRFPLRQRLDRLRLRQAHPLASGPHRARLRGCGRPLRSAPRR
ncbi:MAG: DEAD/DEAH box helicase [Chloroflexi bacterium]|nr:DEAD/DEAH box helicase [Chloroflexota bacterium]